MRGKSEHLEALSAPSLAVCIHFLSCAGWVGWLPAIGSEGILKYIISDQWVGFEVGLIHDHNLQIWEGVSLPLVSF